MEADNRNRKVAVTGATGLVGSNLAAEMVKAGYTDIVVVVRNRGRVGGLERTFGFHGLTLSASPVNIIESDFSDTQSLVRAFSGVDTVFNCAGAIMQGEMTARQLIDNNVSVTRSVVEASIGAGVKKIIHTSSITVLQTPGDHITPITENDTTQATATDSGYTQSKYYADLEITQGRKRGLQTVIVMPAVVLGEGDWSLNGSSALIPVISRGLPVYADGVMAYVDVRDVGRAMIALDGCPAAEGETFILAGGNLSYRELITSGARAAGKRKPWFRIGKGLLLTCYGIVKGLTWLRLMKDRGLERKNLDSVLYGNRYDGSKIEKFCNFTYISQEATVDRIVKNYLSEKRSGKTEK